MPPGSRGTPQPSGRQPAAAAPGGATPLRAASGPASGSIVLPTEDGGYVKLREPVKTIGRGDDAVELRTLSPEEKARRKFKRNLILWGFGLVMIAITLALLLFMGPLG